MRPDHSGLGRTPIWLAAVLMVGYLGVAHRVGNLYPFSSFEMYGSTTWRSASRIVVRGQDGQVHEAGRYATFSCAAPVDPNPEVCAHQWPYEYLPSVDSAIASRINRATEPEPGDGASVEVVRRIWRLDPNHTEPRVSDCVLVTCEASP